jgi:hypothetical protein
MISERLELFYMQAVLPDQNDTTQIPIIKISATLRYIALCFKFHYIWQHCLQAATSGMVHEAVWHEVAFQ